MDDGKAPRTESRTAGVVRHLEELIFGGELEPGQFLPSEGELATTMGVSRLTVREGVRTLQARGLLEVRHGRRPAVAHPNAAPLSEFFAASLRRDPRNLLELVEVRLALEVHAATLAAQHATRTALTSLDLAFDTMSQAKDEEAFNQADVGFHAVLAAAGGNQMISFLIEAMDEPMRQSRLRSLRGHLARGRTMDDIMDEHARILAAVRDRDARGAAEAMREHLVQTRMDLRAFLALPTSDADD
ncbi:FadR/GntR family transcriptional regulator [Nonomuraea jiangxiensis]|uniref:GntR family transcriptional regulator, transcriptional repressor for pyruvate dehydrogenase complex n=1 Tax=Nonomuraea jiangxiensis TaxID=633440 RepID=A0A1G9N3A8_9ACTN|nr:FadR/GntR family transcriptional regulator [Nonomuraea jiangxiensis]SDL80751.1 GntR family transcriptional regulator, transcriptional repressor for pyruvate dehydrogenase complex [Nonomuraea jiangxiensis]